MAWISISPCWAGHNLFLVIVVLLLPPWRQYIYIYAILAWPRIVPLHLSTMATHSLSAKLQVTPPLNHYFTFSIDVAATLELYCDGGDKTMLEKLDGVQSRQYAGYCTEVRPSAYSYNLTP